jgi:hypothetical protein
MQAAIMMLVQIVEDGIGGIGATRMSVLILLIQVGIVVVSHLCMDHRVQNH